MNNSKSEKDCFAHEEEHDDDCSYDAVVIGSGYGGSVAACRMSMAGLKVCLLEKGRRWEAQDFPTNTFQMLSAVRMVNRTLGLSFGPLDALYQVYTQGDSLAAMACGLGGGSLVNAGVLVPAPVRTRRNPKWPKDWESDWELCQASASAMLRAQMVPIKFKNGNVMEMVGEESGLLSQNPVKLGINFDLEDQISDSDRFQRTDSCQACGNCLSGCPYNSKLSTDKNYLLSAIQAGCTVKTECEVQYVVRNPDEIGGVGEAKSGKKGRRWLVYLNDFDYILSDFVVISAGVFGTAKILFRSQARGLKLSKKLGFGLSCNGNNVAYLAESAAPLNAHGMDRKKLSEVPFHERPGPSISSSYISSLGFTIQSAVIPTAFPSILFKGITTYQWPSAYNFLAGILYTVKHLLNQRCQDMVLNVMGYDDGDGKLTFHRDTNEICFRPPSDPLLPQKVEGFHKLAKKLGGILFMSRYRSTSVHLLGGCCASSDASSGVCNSNGQVFDQLSPTTVHPGLYVCDASLIPCSVGINPSLTIATAAEHVSKHLVQDALDYKCKDIEGSKSRKFDEKSGAISSWKLESSQRSAVSFEETMRGNVGGLPCIAYLKIKLSLTADIYERMTDGKSNPCFTGKVGGYIICTALEMDKLHVIDGELDLCQVDLKTPYTQYMHYRLLLAASSGSRYIMEGKKVMNPFLFASYAWKESTTLHVVLRKITDNSGDAMILKGKLHISMLELIKSVISLSGSERTKFLHLLLQSLYRTYISQVPRGSPKGFNPSDLYQSSYPVSIIHEIKAEDGVTISCQQWKCNQGPERHGEGKNPFPVLLINGYCVESYCLPTESNDLVRTLLQEGHETWLLQPRLHPETSINSLTIEDIGRFDVPAAMDKILELHGHSARVHFIAHCIGGLAMHIALMGGHVSCKKIASLSCTNSSMFFKLTTWSKVKLWLPLIPMSMAILGKKDKWIPMFQTLKASPRQKLLKFIARAIPRYERCSCDECEVFSGIFGNSFWHQNISHKMHHWLNKERLPRLPMGAFPHLRKICNAGFIVDAEGRNSYLIHPERMALPTLYLSGGRTLLVTPRTSFMANKYMKLHQPGFRHERVVVDGFGHLDLLIGEESSKKVFPHILSHMASAEKENENAASSVVLDTNERQYYYSSRDALSWAVDPYEDAEEGGFFWSCFSPLINLFFLLLLFSIGFRIFLNFFNF